MSLVFLAWTVAGVACVGDDPISDGDGGSNASSGQSGSGGAGSSSGQASGSSSSSGSAPSSSGAPGGGSSGGGEPLTYIFLSHPVRGDFAANLDFSIFETADALCKQDADAAGLTGPSVAVLWSDTSTTFTGGKERMPPGTAFFLPPLEGQQPSKIAENREELFASGPSVPIDRLATGERASGDGNGDRWVWTGANPPGGGFETCSNWTAGPSAPAPLGWAGNAVSPTLGDTDAWISSAQRECTEQLRLYCVQSP